MYALVIFALLIDGTSQSMAVRYASMPDCEASMQKVRPMMERDKNVKEWTMTCSVLNVGNPA